MMSNISKTLNANPDREPVARQTKDVSDWSVLSTTNAQDHKLTAGKTKKRRPRVAAAKLAQIIEALNANPNARQVARQIGGVSYQTVWNISKAIGIELTAGKAAGGRPKVVAMKRKQILAALKKNPNATEVTREMGNVSYRTVWSIAKAQRIELTAGKRARGGATRIVPCISERSSRMKENRLRPYQPRFGQIEWEV